MAEREKWRRKIKLTSENFVRRKVMQPNGTVYYG